MILTDTNFKKIKETARKHTYGESKRLVENIDADFLLDFVRRSHKAGSISSYNNKYSHHGKSKSYRYSLYVTCIVRRDLETGEEVVYELTADTIA